MERNVSRRAHVVGTCRLTGPGARGFGTGMSRVARCRV